MKRQMLARINFSISPLEGTPREKLGSEFLSEVYFAAVVCAREAASAYSMD